MSNPVLPTLYRTLLRTARQLDAAPISKALLIAQPELLFDRRSRELIRLPELSGSAAHELARRMMAFNRGEFYAPMASAQAAVRSARELPSAADPVDAGFTALRTMSLAVAGGSELESRHAFDCGTPSAVERVTSLRPGDVNSLRAGSLLLTHPVSCLKQPTLHHSVILLVSVDEDAVSGVVINKPLEVTLGGAVSEEVRGALGDTLASAPLYKGGDVSERQLLLLHECEGLSSSTEVREGLWVTSNFVELRAALDDGDGGAAVPSRIKCVAGFAGWARQQLLAELERNVWFLAEAEDVAALAMMERPSGEEAAWLRDHMWSGAMRQLGGEHEHLARFPGDHQLIWSHMKELWEKQSAELHKRIDMLGQTDKADDADD